MILTIVSTSLAKSLAISGVTKHANPLRAKPDSYWLGLDISWEKKEYVKWRNIQRNTEIDYEWIELKNTHEY